MSSVTNVWSGTAKKLVRTFERGADIGKGCLAFGHWRPVPFPSKASYASLQVHQLAPIHCCTV